MKCLVVISHPLSNSLCQFLAKQTIDQLQHLGHEVTIEDLYAQPFSPALTETERATYYQESYDSSAVKSQTKRLLESEAIILVFPTWWFGFPAILKGWFDRVWSPGIAYNHANDLGAITPLLGNLKEVMVITTLGSPWWVDKLVMRQPVKRVLKLALLGACAKHSRLQFLSLYNSEKLEQKAVGAFISKIKGALNKWKPSGAHL